MKNDEHEVNKDKSNIDINNPTIILLDDSTTIHNVRSIEIIVFYLASIDKTSSVIFQTNAYEPLIY